MKWEYKIEVMRMPSSFIGWESLIDQYGKLMAEHKEVLNNHGKDGWEVYHVAGPMFYMKRLDPRQRSERR